MAKTIIDCEPNSNGVYEQTGPANMLPKAEWCPTGSTDGFTPIRQATSTEIAQSHSKEPRPIVTHNTLNQPFSGKMDIDPTTGVAIGGWCEGGHHGAVRHVRLPGHNNSLEFRSNFTSNNKVVIPNNQNLNQFKSSPAEASSPVPNYSLPIPSSLIKIDETDGLGDYFNSPVKRLVITEEKGGYAVHLLDQQTNRGRSLKASQSPSDAINERTNNFNRMPENDCNAQPIPRSARDLDLPPSKVAPRQKYFGTPLGQFGQALEGKTHKGV